MWKRSIAALQLGALSVGAKAGAVSATLNVGVYPRGLPDTSAVPRAPINGG